MVDGRMSKFFEEVTLLKQKFVIDTERTVETGLKDAAKDRRRRGRGHGLRRLPARRGHREAEAEDGADVRAARRSSAFSRIEGADVTSSAPLTYAGQRDSQFAADDVRGAIMPPRPNAQQGSCSSFRARR